MKQFSQTPSKQHVENLPAHWSSRRMHTLGQLKKHIVGDRSDDFTLLSLTLEGVVPRDLENRIGKLPSSFATYQKVEAGDLIFCLFDVEETPRTVGIAMQQGMVTGAYTVMKVNSDVCPRFLYYQYLSFDQEKSLRYLYAGLRNTIRMQDFKNVRLLIPSLEEQRAIADFLDRETAEIDAFIANQEELIALLEERRTAIITHALTEAMEESDNIRLRFVAKFNPPVPVSVRSHPEAAITFLPMDAIHERGGFNRSQSRRVKQVEKGYSYFENGDVIYAKVTPCFENRKSAVLESLPHTFGFGTTEVTVLRPEPSINAKYLLYTLLEDRFHQYGKAFMTGAGGLKRVPESVAQDFKIPFPPLAEQIKLVDELNREGVNIDAAVTDAREAIVLSRERRAALISAAVTGQIDVTQKRKPVAEVLEDEVRV